MVPKQPERAIKSMSQLGKNVKYSTRVDVFRFATKLGHYSVRSVLRICAISDRRTAASSIPIQSRRQQGRAAAAAQ
jgi:hypothetical protein